MIPGLIITDHIRFIDGNYGARVMKNRYRAIFMFLGMVLLSACSTSEKLDSSGIDLSITPQQAVSESTVLRNTQVLWGGVVVSSINLKDVTQFEILAYPLTSEQRPDTEQPATGRFLALQEGYLEISRYVQGSLMTISGSLQDKRSGRVGESDYIYPVIKIKQFHLWEKRQRVNQPQFHFGLGMQF